MSAVSRVLNAIRARLTGISAEQVARARGVIDLHARGRYFEMLGLPEGAVGPRVLQRKRALEQELSWSRDATACLTDCFAVLNPPRVRRAYLKARHIFEATLNGAPEPELRRAELRLWPLYWRWLCQERYHCDADRLVANEARIQRWLGEQR